jgi:hypothetical protein
MQGDRGLARSRAALDEHDARVRLGDEAELLAVDERGDLLEVLVRARARGLVVDAELAAPPSSDGR